MILFRSLIFFKYILIVLLVECISCDVIRFGKCPIVKVQEDFENRLFAGTWFEVLRNPMLVLLNTKCNRLDFELKGVIYKIKNSFVHKSFEKNITFEGNAFSNEENEPAKLTVRYPVEFLQANVALPYWIVHTDYETALIWSCTEYINFFHVEYLWILSRSRNISDDKIEELLELLNGFGVNTSLSLQVDQNDCKN